MTKSSIFPSWFSYYLVPEESCMWEKSSPRRQLLPLSFILGSFYFLRYVWEDELQPQAYSSSTAHTQLHWGSALVVHQMFNVISLLKVVTKPQRVKWWQSVKQSSLYIFFSFSIIFYLMSLFLVCNLLIVYFCSFPPSVFYF
jgi:hypothetical protein